VAFTQVPWPSHVAAGVKPPAAQAAARHTVVLPYFSHVPLPSQWLVVPHVSGTAGVPHRPCGSSLPAAIAAQVPSGDEEVSAFRHEEQVSAQGLSQHTPSTQLREAHSLPPAHGFPFAVGVGPTSPPSPRAASGPFASASRSGLPSTTPGASMVTPASTWPNIGCCWQTPLTHV
jgi:hypothetical protein